MLAINDNIILYSTGCPRCTVLEKKLEAKGIDFSFNNSIEEMESLGIMEVPVLYVDGERMSFSEAVSWINRQ